MTRSYLEAMDGRNSLRLLVPRVFLWFVGDFGGPHGVRRFLSEYGHETALTRLRFARYDWSLQSGPWVEAATWTGSERDVARVARQGRPNRTSTGAE